MNAWSVSQLQDFGIGSFLVSIVIWLVLITFERLNTVRVESKWGWMYWPERILGTHWLSSDDLAFY